MDNNKLFNYNNKVYKTEAAMKKAKTMDAKPVSYTHLTLPTKRIV